MCLAKLADAKEMLEKKASNRKHTKSAKKIKWKKKTASKKENTYKP